jgi:hypothetical protein
MSIIVKLMIGGWATTLAMIGYCALNESGKLFNLRNRIASLLGTFDAGNGSSARTSRVGRASGAAFELLPTYVGMPDGIHRFQWRTAIPHIPDSTG